MIVLGAQETVKEDQVRLYTSIAKEIGRENCYSQWMPADNAECGILDPNGFP